MNDRGYTILEAVLALAILSIALVGMLPSFQAMLDANSLTEERSNGVAAVQQVLEGFRQVDPATLPTSGTSPTFAVTVGHHEYEIVARFCTRPEFCNGASRHIALEVGFAGKTIHAVETVYTRLR